MLLCKEVGKESLDPKEEKIWHFEDILTVNHLQRQLEELLTVHNIMLCVHCWAVTFALAKKGQFHTDTTKSIHRKFEVRNAIPSIHFYVVSVNLMKSAICFPFQSLNSVKHMKRKLPFVHFTDISLHQGREGWKHKKIFAFRQLNNTVYIHKAKHLIKTE